MTIDAAWQRLIDESAIRDLIYRYPASIDRHDWAGFREIFCNEIEADFTRAGHKSAYKGPAAGWIKGIAATVDAMDGTHHQLDNLRIDPHGDSATAHCAFYAIHVLRNTSGDSRYDVAGFYDFELVRQAEGWRVRKYAAVMNLRFGNPHIFKLAGTKAGNKNKEFRHE